MLFLKQSTSVTVQFGPFVDAGDGVALEVGLATAMDNASTGVRLSKNGGTLADRADATAPAYDAMGFYKIVLGTGDTDTLGTLLMTFEEAATCLPGWMEFMIMPANVWDSMFGADALDVSVIQWLGTAAAAPTTAGVPEVDITFVGGSAEDLPTATALATAQTDLDTLTGSDGATLATTQGNYAPSKAGDAMTLTAAAVDLVWDELMAGHVTADTAGLVLNDWQDGGRLDAILDARMAEASIDTTGGAVDTVTTTATATNLTNSPTSGDLTATMKASVNAEVDTALVTTTYDEPAQGAPGVDISIEEKISWLYKTLRNRKNSTATLIQIYNDDATTVDHKKVTSDNGTTYDEGEMITGA